MFEHIDYDPTSSTFFRFNQDWGVRVKAGDEAGTIRSKKYNKRVELCVNKKNYPGSRVAWFYLHDEEVPKGMFVVPLDGDQRNLSKDNLVLMTWRQQRVYVAMTKNHQSCAIRPNKNGTYRSYFVIREGGKRTCEPLGTYPTLEEAVEVYRRKQMQAFFKENR